MDYSKSYPQLGVISRPLSVELTPKMTRVANKGVCQCWRMEGAVADWPSPGWSERRAAFLPRQPRPALSPLSRCRRRRLLPPRDSFNNRSNRRRRRRRRRQLSRPDPRRSVRVDQSYPHSTPPPSRSATCERGARQLGWSRGRRKNLFHGQKSIADGRESL